MATAAIMIRFAYLAFSASNFSLSGSITLTKIHAVKIYPRQVPNQSAASTSPDGCTIIRIIPSTIPVHHAKMIDSRAKRYFSFT